MGGVCVCEYVCSICRKCGIGRDSMHLKLWCLQHKRDVCSRWFVTWFLFRLHSTSIRFVGRGHLPVSQSHHATTRTNWKAQITFSPRTRFSSRSFILEFSDDFNGIRWCVFSAKSHFVFTTCTHSLTHITRSYIINFTACTNFQQLDHRTNMFYWFAAQRFLHLVSHKTFKHAVCFSAISRIIYCALDLGTAQCCSKIRK